MLTPLILIIIIILLIHTYYQNKLQEDNKTECFRGYGGQYQSGSVKAIANTNYKYYYDKNHHTIAGNHGEHAPKMDPYPSEAGKGYDYNV